MNLSVYVNKLPNEAKIRYNEKIKLINNVDPYTLTDIDWDKDYMSIPKVSRYSIIDYLIFKTSWETQAQMRAYKSMDAFIKVACEWVKKIHFKKFDAVFLLLGSVMHSQKLNMPSLKPWLVMSHTGEVLCGHCDCAAGLGEVCTHVAAILFAVQKLSDDPESVTGIFAYWRKPASKPDTVSTIYDINWKLTATSDDTTAVNKDDVPEMSREEMIEFLKKYKDAEQLSVLHNVCEELATDEPMKPNNIVNLYLQNYENSSLTELQRISCELNINISVVDCNYIEQITRDQAKCKEWFLYRAGRITASKFKAACRTKIEKPSLSLIKSICYPHIYKKVYKQMEYGCVHEKHALETYLTIHKSQHANVELQKVGLVINPDFPEFGASPDALVMCSECGEGCVEVKCPYCIKDLAISDLADKKQSCLTVVNDKMILKKEHSYFYQVQMQLFVSQKNYCDFVVWNEKEVYIEKVEKNFEFWNEEKEKASQFFRKCILPEILGKYYTRNDLAQPGSSKM